MYVGNGGSGIVNVSTGATMNLGSLQVGVTNGTAGTGTVTVDGAGTSTPTVTTSGATLIGNGGTGALSILNHGIYNAGGFINLYASGGNASLNVSGAFAKVNITGVASLLQIGVAADSTNTASAIVQNGGSINFDPTVQGPTGTALYVGGTSNGSLTITGAGLSVSISHDVVIGRNFLGTGSVGTLSLVNNGTLIINGAQKIYLGGSLDGETFHGGTGIINFGSITGTSGAANASGTLSFTGNMLLEGNSQINFNNIASDTTTLAANILNDFAGATLALSKVGGGTAILSGNNNYAGATTVSVGTLQAGSTTGFSANSDFAVNGILNLAGFSNTVGSLAGSGTVTTGTAATLTVGVDGATTAFSGVLQNGAGTLALTKAGTGTLTLSGNNSYSGVTTVNAGGTLQAGSTTGLSSSSAFTVNGSLNLGGNSNTIGSLAGNGTVSDTGLAATLTAGGNNASTIFSGVLQDGTGPGTLALTKTGTGTFTLAGTNTYSGGTNFNVGILAVSNDNNLGTGTLTFNGGTLETTGSITSSKTVALTGGGTFLTDLGTTSSLNGTISGAGPLTKSGTGTLTLTGTNLYSGGTNFNSGVLAVGNDSNPAAGR